MMQVYAKTNQEKKLEIALMVSLVLNFVLLAGVNLREMFPEWTPYTLTAMVAIYFVYRAWLLARYPDNAVGARISAEAYIHHGYWGGQSYSTKLEHTEVIPMGNIWLVGYHSERGISHITLTYKPTKGIVGHEKKDIKLVKEEMENSEIRKAEITAGKTYQDKINKELYGDDSEVSI